MAINARQNSQYLQSNVHYIPLPMNTPIFIGNGNLIAITDQQVAGNNSENHIQNKIENHQESKQNKNIRYDMDDDCSCQLTALCIIAIFVGIVLLIVGIVYGNETVPINPKMYDPSPQEHVNMAPGLKISGGVTIGIGFIGLILTCLFLIKNGKK